MIALIIVLNLLAVAFQVFLLTAVLTGVLAGSAPLIAASLAVNFGCLIWSLTFA